MKKLLSLLLVMMMSVTMLMPQTAFADEEAVQETDAVQTSEEEQLSDTPQEADLQDQEKPAEEAAEETPAETETAETAEEEPVQEQEETQEETQEEEQAEPAVNTAEFDSYRKVGMPYLYENNGLVLPESMTEAVSEEDATPKVVLSKTKYGNGLLFTGTAADLMSGRITIGTDFDFDSGDVGRICVDGLSDRSVDVTVHVYLDDETEPAASFTLGYQMGKREWANAGDITKNVIDKKISGKHTVSFSFEISGIKATKSTSVCLRSVEFCKLSIPVMYFNITGGSVEAMNNSPDHSAECYGTVDLVVPDAFDSDETFRDEYGQQKSLTGVKLEYIRGRGNSTWDADKKPYKVKFDKKQDLFGLGGNKHWTLIANRYDNSLVRNRMTYWLGKQFGLDYTPECVPVEVVMDGEYYGSYLLCEQIRIGKGRVEIDDLDDEPLSDDPVINSGGYLLSMESYGENSDNSIVTEKGVNMFIESPSFEKETNQVQLAYIKAFIQSVENAIAGDDFKDASGTSYTEYLDLDAASKYWWIQEFSANGDAYGSGSTYLYKKRDPSQDEREKLYWGPLWDFDYVAWGDLEYDISAPEGLENTSMTWFEMMKNDPQFLDKIKSDWPVLKSLLQEVIRDGGKLDQYQEQMLTSYIYDHEKWGSFSEDETNEPFRSYEYEIDQLREWISQRITNAESAIGDLTPQEYTVKFILDGKTVKERKYFSGKELGAFPEAPEKAGYVFCGWRDELFEFYYSPGDTVYSDLTLVGTYIREDKIVKAKDLYFGNYDVYVNLATDFYDDEDPAYTIDYVVMPEEAMGYDITWTSSDETVAETTEDGLVICKSTGEAVITGKLSTGGQNSFTIHIADDMNQELNEVDYIELDKDAVSIEKNGYTQIRSTVGPLPCYSADLTWISTDEDVASVDSYGIVTGNKAGTATILCFEMSTGIYRTCKVTVTDNAAKIKAARSAKCKITTKAYNNHKIHVRWKKVKGVSGYAVYCATRKNGKYKRVATVKKAKNIRWISAKLKKGKKYYFKVRPYTKINGKNYYGKWSNVSARKAK